MLNNFKVLSFKKKDPSINYLEIDKFFLSSKSINEIVVWKKIKLRCFQSR